MSSLYKHFPPALLISFPVINTHYIFLWVISRPVNPGEANTSLWTLASTFLFSASTFLLEIMRDFVLLLRYTGRKQKAFLDDVLL